jgi:pimeloyl-ACP methyl ester carboxylesterase
MDLPQFTHGPADGRRALLVHGLNSSAASWGRVGDALVDAGWNVTTVDLRGHGTAPRADSYALADYAADLPRARWDVVVAHSLGGAAAVIAAADPEFAAQLVLLDPVLEVPAGDRDGIIADQVAELALDAMTLAELKPHWDDRDRAAKLEGVRLVDPVAASRSFTDTGVWDVVAEATVLTTPTLVLAGDPEVYTMLAPETALAVASANPLVDYRVISGAGHSPHRDRPVETIEALLGWLASPTTP